MKWTFGKIAAVGCGSFIVVSIIAVTSWFFFVNSVINGMGEEANAQLKETIRLNELPSVKGVVFANKEYAAPFSGDSVTLCILKVGVEIVRTGRVHGVHRPRPKWAFDHVNTILPNNTVVIKVGDKLYPIDFGKAIFKGIAVRNDYRFDEATFATNSYSAYDLLREMTSLDDEISKSSPGPKREYLIKLKKLESLMGYNILIDKYINSALNNKGLYNHVNIEEINYRHGDSIKLNAKIVGNKIVPLF